ncbi:putative pectinesterase/pectinesterase inhibitor 34 [Raphanus sativus]|uniref:Pectinesterase n=1 Tax=Raphanus sativus TaxID=3726 RepID=A0A6J0MHI9_RAPSA|nr:probable pectinesterase/pectinesterase inhibitor 34 [Raphanus sativus]KAJ4910524.1 putative pectinesterase/pectinesterase inhibitor 34 [Raphanus sativus]
MGYERLGPSKPSGSVAATTAPAPNVNQVSTSTQPENTTNGRRKKLLVSSIVVAFALILAAAIFAGVRSNVNSSQDVPGLARKPSQEISKACEPTRFPELCVDSLMDFPGSLAASSARDLIHVTVNMTLHHFSHALYSSSSFSFLDMPPRVRSAYDSCLELLDDSVDALSRALYSVVSVSTGQTKPQDVMTWLSSALTNHDTCVEGFDGVGGDGGVKDQMTDALKNLSELVSNCLAIFAANGDGDGNDFAGVPIQNKRRLLEAGDENLKFPRWTKRREREILEMPVTQIQADIIVSKDGNGTCKTISEAIKKAPQYSSRRIIIYVKAGRYEENNLKVGRKKINLMFVGDGKGKTVISGGKSIFDNVTTFHTASFAASGAGFIARDITFENWAGPAKHQAVALRIGADHAVIYRCNIIGYQDTLYVHSNRQFFRECDIYGTVDFIFGNAAVVLQNCSIYARKPMDLQKNTITAQNRKDPNQNTGISIHASRVLATPDLQAANGTIQTYLGRPWKLFSRTVYMLSYIGSHVHTRGWLEWNTTFALDTLYYGEYLNTGPGSNLSQRVNWPGYRVINSTAEANRFTVTEFIYGSSWLPSTGVSFLAGLNI